MGRIAVLLAFITVVLPVSVQSAEFELDLKELRKPIYTQSAPGAAPARKRPVATRKKNSSVPVQKPQEEPTTEKQSVVVQGDAAVSLPMAELVLQTTDGCTLGEQVALAVGRRAPVEELLFGLPLKTRAGVRHAGLQLLLSCDLSSAEAYTYSRLLEEHHVQLLNLFTVEPPPHVVSQVLEALALTYRYESVDGGSGYLILPEGRRPLHLTIR